MHLKPRIDDGSFIEAHLIWGNYNLRAIFLGAYLTYHYVFTQSAEIACLGSVVFRPRPLTFSAISLDPNNPQITTLTADDALNYEQMIIFYRKSTTPDTTV